MIALSVKGPHPDRGHKKLTNTALVTLAEAAALLLLGSHLGQRLARDHLGHGVVGFALRETERALNSMGAGEAIWVVTSAVARVVDGVDMGQDFQHAGLVQQAHGILIGKLVAGHGQSAPAGNVGRPGEVSAVGGVQHVRHSRGSGWGASGTADESVHQQGQDGQEDELKRHGEGVIVCCLMRPRRVVVLFFVVEKSAVFCGFGWKRK
jgi:hypothetical protein